MAQENMLSIMVFSLLPVLLFGFVMYPYKQDSQTDTQLNGGEIVVLPFDLVAFGKKYSSVWISNNGYISLTTAARSWQAVSWPQVEEYRQTMDEMKDPTLIAPYYAQTHLDKRGHVFYEFGTEYSEITSKAVADVRESIHSANKFQATHTMMVSWVNATFLGGGPGANATNSFQAVLVTDGIHTYAIFNYNEVSWTGGVQANGDPNTGLGATLPPAQAGFNVGRGNGWYSLTSANGVITDLDIDMGSNKVGQYIYSIESEYISRASCSPTIVNSDNSLVLSRPGGSMYGGESLHVSGPCLSSDGANTKCRFDGSVVVNGENINRATVRCVPPKFFKRGRIDVEMSVDNGATWPYKGVYTIAEPGRIQDGVTLSNKDAWASLNPKSLGLSWEPETLGCSSVYVWLVGYKEDQGGQPSYKRLVKLGEGMLNGKLTFEASSKKCNKGEECLEYEIGVVEVSCPRDNQDNPRRVQSPVLPLGWYFKDAMDSQHGSDWIEDKCVKFRNEDEKSKSWLETLPYCPCTMEQAMADFARWQPDVGCDISSGSVCRYHQGAVHCVRSTQPSSSGAGNQCCYNKQGDLMYAADSYNGSTPDRGHDWGASPYMEAPRVPKMSHWIKDVITFYYCCLWIDGYCHNYMDLRPTRDCINYKTPKPAVAYGDPHFDTFDSRSYTFNGKGEFWLVKSDNFKLQARFEEPQNVPFNNVNATVVTSVAMQEPSLDMVEVRLNPVSQRQKDDVTVLVNTQPQRFDEHYMKWQDFKGVSVVSNVKEKQTNFTVLFKNGVGVQVAAVDSLLNIIVVVPPSFKMKTKGLLGSWDDNKNNDFTDQNGTEIQSNSDGKTIHEDFGLKWRVTETESFFFYTGGKPYASFHDANFQPDYEIPSHPNSTFTEDDVNAICQGNTQCKWDYRATGDANVARATLAASARYQRLVSQATHVKSCGLLPVKNAVKDNYAYLVGSKVKVTGCVKGYVLTGEEKEYECVENTDGTAAWNKNVTVACLTITTTSENKAGLSPGEEAGLAVGIILALIAILVVLGIIFWLRRKTQHEKKLAEKGTVAKDPESGPPAGQATSKDNEGFEEVALESKQTESTEASPEQRSGAAKSYRFATADKMPEEETPKKTKSGGLKMFGRSKKSKSSEPGVSAENPTFQS